MKATYSSETFRNLAITLLLVLIFVALGLYLTARFQTTLTGVHFSITLLAWLSEPTIYMAILPVVLFITLIFTRAVKTMRLTTSVDLVLLPTIIAKHNTARLYNNGNSIKGVSSLFNSFGLNSYSFYIEQLDHTLVIKGNLMSVIRISKLLNEYLRSLNTSYIKRTP